MRKSLFVVLLLVVVVSTAHAGGFFSWLFGEPEHLTVPKDGTATVTTMAFKDVTLCNHMYNGYLPDDPIKMPHFLKMRDGTGWFVRGLANFTNGSGYTGELTVSIDSGGKFFRPEPAPPSRLSQDQYLAMHCMAVLQPTKDGQFVVLRQGFEPFVTYDKVGKAYQGPVFFVFNTAYLTTGAHQLYINTKVYSGNDRLTPAEVVIPFCVDDECSPEGQFLLHQQFKNQQGQAATDSGQTPGYTPLADPAQTPPTITPSSNPMRHDQIVLTPDAQNVLARFAAAVGLPTDNYLSDVTFAVTNPELVDNQFSNIIFFLVHRDGTLVDEPMRFDSKYLRGRTARSKLGGPHKLFRPAFTYPGTQITVTRANGQSYTVVAPPLGTCAWKCIVVPD